MGLRAPISSVIFVTWATVSIGLATDSNAGVNLTVDASFDSLDSNDTFGPGTLVPPDPDLAVGPSQVVVTVNTALQIYTKTGVPLTGPIDLTDFFGGFGGDCETASAAFPSILHDAEADRFVLAYFVNGQRACVAVTQTGDPNGAYFRYSFTLEASGFLDWPRLGIGRDAIYIGGELFPGGDSRVYALNKTAMYAGLGATMTSKTLGGNVVYPQPLNLTGSADNWPEGDSHFFVAGGELDFGVATLYAWTDPFGSDQIGSLGSLDIASVHGTAVAAPMPAPQSGGSTIGGTIFGRFPDFDYNNGTGWITSAVTCNPGSGETNCTQWVQLNLSTLEVVQAGLFASADVHRIYPDLAVNRCGDMAVGYTRTSSTSFPSIWAAGRHPSDPAGSLRPEVIVKAGELTYSAFDGEPLRWGERANTTLDPDGSTFWHVGPYSKNNGNASANWGTWVASMSFGQCDASTIFVDGFESGNAGAWTTGSP